MKRWRFTVVALMLVGLITMMASAAKDSDKAKVGFTLEKHFSLKVKQGDSVEFGQIDPLVNSHEKKGATTLEVKSNAEWNLSASKEVTQKPNDADDNDVLNALSVELETTEGRGNDTDIKVDYALSDLDRLPSGDYVIEVTFTGSTK